MTAIKKAEKADVAETTRKEAERRQVRVSTMGVGAVLFDPSTGGFDPATQNRLRGLSIVIGSTDSKAKGVLQVVLGLNNLLVVFDPLLIEPNHVTDWLQNEWTNAESKAPASSTFSFDVDYGGDGGPDLIPLSEATGLSVAEIVRLHSEATYTVATIGSNPGLAYMAGLPKELQVKRLATPRLSLPARSVIIAGEQASVTPMVAPCGWHALGTTDVTLFDPFASPACLLAPGDIVRFKVRKVLS